MKTIQKLDRYGNALRKWKAQKSRHELDVKLVGYASKPLPDCPKAVMFELSESDEYAVKLKIHILGKPVKIPRRNV